MAVLSLLLFVSTCSQNSQKQDRAPAPEPGRPSANVLENYLKNEFPVADGFDFAVGDANGKGSYQEKSTGRIYNGWYVAVPFAKNYSYGIHPAEDWSGLGPSETDLGQDVHTVAIGRVAFAGFCGKLWGNVVMVDLRWDQSLGPTFWPSSNGKDVAWIKEHYTAPTPFINAHRSVPAPQGEAALLLVDQNTYKMRFYKRGQLQGEFDVSFGQAKGSKEVQGDNKTPTGMYFVTQKHSGNFDGPYGAYYGGYWIKINYPNAFDAERGKAAGLISSAQQAAISKQWGLRTPTLETTRLGGGIGFHGWIREWENNGPRHPSWGCVVMHLYDISKLYAQIPAGSMVVIF